MPLTEIAASNLKLTPLGKSYYDHYSQQRGGAFPVFRGGLGYQGGNGLSEILKSAGQFFLPIAASAAQKFVESASDSMSQGKSLSASSKDAIKPTLLNAAENITEKLFQKGKGRKRRRRKNSKKKQKFTKKRSHQRFRLKKKHAIKNRRGYRAKRSHKKTKYNIDTFNF